METSFEETIQQHWAPDPPGTILSRIKQGLLELGKDIDALTQDDLLAVDEFHIRGREATTELATLADVSNEDRVIDLGSGLGGPSRYLASTTGCCVDGIDLTAEYCAIATELARRVGLAANINYQRANALELPFGEDTFDLAWTQHISMNIQDKARFFSEMFRILKVGGRAAIYDPICGSGEPIRFPVPWARDDSTNFLIDANKTRRHIEKAGFRIEKWHDVSEKSVAWFEKNAKLAAEKGPQALGLHLLLGSDWPVMAKNMAENIAAGSISVIQVVARKGS
ncbi:MAG TPA: SAM-dependent methyltransferase [Gammaproteobacteria bacterium]|nr:SAM-dependent methyltransferase [Gammaproteobacteria bacterium]|tara:strand:- start:221 stop:1066 length:846 start_codon:yes stop_codon:yes gene_type:complete